MDDKTYSALPSSKNTKLASISRVNRKSPQITYKVKKGDTLWKISKRYEVKPEDIKKWNQLGATARIHPGDNLTIHLRNKAKD